MILIDAAIKVGLRLTLTALFMENKDVAKIR
jgi:hypothetical protein